MFNNGLQLSGQVEFLSTAPPFNDPGYWSNGYEKTDNQGSLSSILMKSCNSSNIMESNQSGNESFGKSKESYRKNSKRKLFTLEEDQLLTMAAIEHNHASWNDIAKLVPGRTPKQCRDRWTNYLQPSLKFDPWTLQEDKNLITLVKSNGTHWNRMRRYFPGRSTNSIKNRWHWLLNNNKPFHNDKTKKNISHTIAQRKKEIKLNYEKKDFMKINIGKNNHFDVNNANPEGNNCKFNNQRKNDYSSNNFYQINQNINHINTITDQGIDYIQSNMGNMMNDNPNNIIKENNDEIFKEDELIVITPEELDW
ncbi:hypothetical protein M9Y10_010637 [Tritrichomonas musculus]|uniref:Myb-like DNA-binding domain containing protein n=1 Tax=Tritrichomonas musculus TaxID=1915356 RepID=A0ABR2ILC9_9EUKA